MKLLLTSAGLTTKKIQERFFEMVGKSPNEIRVAYISTATNPELDKSYIYRDWEILNNLGVKYVEIDIAKYPDQTVVEVLTGTDVIWMAGGNAFYLLDVIRKQDFAGKLRELIETKVYVGVSAGSIVTTPSVAVALVEPSDANDVGLTDFTGLGWVDFEVSPHTPDIVTQSNTDAYAKTCLHKVYSLNDRSAIAVWNDQVELLLG